MIRVYFLEETRGTGAEAGPITGLVLAHRRRVHLIYEGALSEMVYLRRGRVIIWGGLI